MLNGLLNMKQIFEILRLQVDSDLRFGEQAIMLNYLNRDQLNDLLEEQRNRKPGVGAILYELGFVKKGVLQKNRREFMRGLEAMLI